MGFWKKTLLILLTVCLCAGCTPAETAPPADAGRISNDFTDEVARAIDAFAESEPAELIAGVSTDENVLALVFAGNLDIETMRSVWDIVKKYDITCTFFLNGAAVAEYGEIIPTLTDEKRSVGSYTLYGMRHMHDMLEYDMIKDFVYSSELIERASNAAPEYLLCNSSRSTEELLRAAEASGFGYVVEATAVLNYQSFTDYDMANNYVRRLPNGSIIEIKLDGVLDDEEYVPASTRQDVGKEAGITQMETHAPVVEDEKERLLKVTEWVCRAICESERGIVPLRDLPALPPPSQPNFSPADFTGMEVALAPGAVFDYLFYGVTDGVALEHVLATLKVLEATGTFFVSEKDITAYPDRIRRIIDGGHKLGAALLPELVSKEDAEASLRIIFNKFISEFEVYSTLALVPYGETSVGMRDAALAFGMELIEYDAAIVRSTDANEISADSLFTKLFNQTIRSLRDGDKLFFRLDYYKGNSDLAGDLIKKCLEHEGLLLHLENLREENQGRLAGAGGPIYTAERALSYVFYGIENAAATDHMLTRMRSISAKGTFFVTAQEIVDDPARIEAIKAGGHEIGVALLQREDMDFLTAAFDLMYARELLAGFDVEARLVMLPYGTAGEVACEAVSALDMALIKPSVSMARSTDEYATSASRVMGGVFSSDTPSLKRGDILYFRLNFYKNSDDLAGDLARLVKQTYVDPVKYSFGDAGDSAYAIRTASRLINGSGRYSYPLRSSKVPSEVRDAIKPGHLDGMGREQIISRLASMYIGTPYMTNQQMLPGFAEQEISLLDSTGKINTGDSRTIFLTFDDWGNDVQLNQLLYVLEKHGVKASFFIRTHYVKNNPNLLRAIAEAGHDIGSHTENHMTLANYDEAANTYSDLTASEVTTLYAELTDSYKTLIDIAGDVQNEQGRPAVQPFFRSPTLAQSFQGMRAVADCGYKYSIGGDFSTGDYNVSSAAELYDILVNGLSEEKKIGAGSIVVMHISPSAQYTAEALDMFLTANRHWRFARLSDYLR